MAERDGFYRRGRFWWVRTDPVTRKARTTHCTSLAAARAWRGRRELEAVDPSHAAAEAATLGEWIGRLIEVKAPVRSEATMGIYRMKLGHFVRLWGNDCRLAEVGPDLVDAYVRQRRTEGVTDQTIGKELSHIKMLLRLAKRSSVWAGDLETIRPPDLNATYVPRKRSLTREEVVRLLAQLPPHRGALVAICVALGVRLSEAFRLLPTDVDLAAGRVFVGGTKTQGSRRWLPVLSVYRPLLEGAVGYLPLAHWKHVHESLLAACLRAGIERCSPNDLRRTHSTLLVELGVDRDVVRRLLGHTTSALVDRVYGQPTPEALGLLAEAKLAGVEPLHSRYTPGATNEIPSTTPVNQIGQHSRVATPRIAELVLDLRGKDPTGPGETWGSGGRLGAGTLQPATVGGLLLEHWALSSAAHRVGVLP
jgi:integrase